MSFLNKIFRRHEEEFNIDDIPVGDYDPTASQQKVDHFLADVNKSPNTVEQTTSNQQQFNNPPSEAGLPPDPNQDWNKNLNQYDNHRQNNIMPNGMTGQELANKYAKQQEYLEKQANINQTNSPTTEKNTHQEEIINLKLDSMKNQLDAINQRILRIEQLLNNSNRKW